MATPRETFEAYNRYRPPIPPPPTPSIPWYNPQNIPLFRPTTPQQRQETWDWAREPTFAPKDQRGFFDPNQTLTEKLYTNLFPNILDAGLSVLEADGIYDPQRTKTPFAQIPTPVGSMNLYNPFSQGEKDFTKRARREHNALQLGATAMQKSLARNSVIGEDLANRALYRSIPELLDLESLAAAGAWSYGIKKLAYGGTAWALGKTVSKVPRPSVKEILSINSSKTGGPSSLTNVEKLKGYPKVGWEYTKWGAKKVGGAIAEPIIPDNFVGNFALELGAENSIEAAIVTYGDSMKYHNANMFTAITTAALTAGGGMFAVGLAAGLLKKSIDNVAKNEIFRPPTKHYASNKTSNVEAAQIAKETEDKNFTSISQQGHINNPEIAHKQLVVSKNISDMLSSDFKLPPNVADKRMFEADGVYYPANEIQAFKNTLFKISPQIKAGGYEKDLLTNKGDIKFDNLWEKSQVIRKINGKEKRFVDLLHLEKNISSENVIAREVHYAGVGEDIPVGLGNTENNIDMIKKFYNPDVTTYHPSSREEILRMNRTDNEVQKIVNNSGPQDDWNTKWKPLIKYEREHSVKMYNNLPEESKDIIREEFRRKYSFGKQTFSSDAVDEIMFDPFYYYEPKLSGNFKTDIQRLAVGSKDFKPEFGQGRVNHKYFKNKDKFDNQTFDDLLDNPYMKMFALSKLFREHSTYFKFENDTSRIEDLVRKNKLFHSPLENPLRDRNIYHGFSKLLDPEYGVTDNENVMNGLRALKLLYDNKISVKDRDKIKEISPYFEMPDTMIWGSKHSQFSIGNHEIMQKAIDLEVDIPVHAGASSYQDFASTQPEGFAYLNKNLLGVEGQEGLMGMIGGMFRIPAIFGRRLGSQLMDPDLSLHLGAIDPHYYMTYQRGIKGRDIQTVIGGGPIIDTSDPAVESAVKKVQQRYRDNLNTELSEEEAKDIVTEIIRFQNLNEDLPIELFEKELGSYTMQLKLDPMSNAAKINRQSGRSAVNTGGKDGYPFQNQTYHHSDNDGQIGWDRRSSFTLNLTDDTGKPILDANGEKPKAYSLNEVQSEGAFSAPDTDTGVNIPFETNEPFSVKDNINSLKDAAGEFSNMVKPEITNQATRDAKEFGPAVDLPPIGGNPNQSLFGIFSLLRPKHHSKNIVDNFDKNLEMIQTNSNQLNDLDNTIGNKIQDHSVSSYSALKSISDTNRNPLPIDGNEISFSGGLSEAIDENAKAFMFATLEFYLKATVSPHVSYFYKSGQSSLSYTHPKRGPNTVLKELILDMGYEKVHDWKNWKESDWVLKNNKDGRLGQKIVNLFEYLNPNKDKSNPMLEDLNQSQYDFDLKYDHPKWGPMPINLADEFGGFRIIQNEEDSSFIKFVSDRYDSQIMPWVKKDELVKFFNSPVNKEAYEHYSKRLRAQLYLHKSNYTNEPRRVFHHVKDYIETAIKTGHTYLVLPTGDELVNRNMVSPQKGVYLRKLYDKKIPNTLSFIMKEQYDVNVRFDKDFRHKVPTEDEVPRNYIKGAYEDQINKEGVLTRINDSISIMKIPKKIIDDYEKTKEIPLMTFYKTDDGEIKAVVNFKTDGKASILAFDKADLRSAIHEVGHVLRRDLDDEELKIVNNYFNIKDGVWTREAEEQFANAVENYYINNKIPDPSLVAPFKKLLKLIGYLFKTHIYADLIHGKQKAKFDKLLENLMPDIPDNELSREFLKSDEMVTLTVRMAEAFNTTIDEAKGVMATIQARALAWADETGGNPSDWWKERGFDIADKQAKSLVDYKKLNTDIIDEQLTDGTPSLVGSERFNSVLDKVIDLVRQAPKERKRLQDIIDRKKKQAVAMMHNTLGRSQDRGANGIDNPQETLGRTEAHLKGTGVSNSVFDPIAELGDNQQVIPRSDVPESETLLADEISILYNEIQLKYLADPKEFQPFDALNTRNALTKILLGEAPNNYEIKLLKKAFGKEGERLAMAARKKKSSAFGIKGATYRGIFDDLFRQSPLALLSGFDASAVLRQSWFITTDPTKARLTLAATWRMIQAMVSGNRARYLYDAIVSDPYYNMFQKSGLEIIEPDTTSQLTEWKKAFGRSPEDVKERELTSYFDPEIEATGEEVFGGGGAVFVKMFPVIGQVVKMSERGYTTFLNLVRFEIAKAQYLAAKKRGYIHPYDPDLRKPVADSAERAEQIAQGNIRETYNDLYFEPEELGYTRLDDIEVVAISDIANIATGAGRLNKLYELDETTNQVKATSKLVRALSTIFWSPKLVVSRFKMVLGGPLFELKSDWWRVKADRLGVERTSEALSANIRTYLKRTKSGKPYWAGIEMTGTAFFGNSKLAKILKGSRFYNGEGFEISIGGSKKVITMPDVGIRMMLIPNYISAGLTATGLYYGIQKHFENNNINGSVEFNPNSSDFGKVTIGNTKFDTLGGYAQAVRFLANMYSGRKVSSGTQNEREMERGEIIENFLRSKGSPPVGALYSAFVKKETFTGEPFEWNKDLWELMISMNVQDTYEIFANSLPEDDEGRPFSRMAKNIAKSVASSLGAGAQTYVTADDIIRGYFVNKDGTRYRYSEMEPYIQAVAKTVIPETNEIFGDLASKEKTIDEIMGVWEEETEGSSRGDLNAQEVAKARLYLLQRIVTQDNEGYWRIANRDVIKKGTDPETGKISRSSLGYALFQKALDITREFEDVKNGMYNALYGVKPVIVDEDKELEPKFIAKQEYVDAQKAARSRELAPAGFDPYILDPLMEAWEKKYAPRLSELKDEDGITFTHEAIAAIEKNPSILNRYVTEEWKYTMRNMNQAPIPIGILYAITDLGVNVDGTRSAYSKFAWAKWVLPQILREEHIKTQNFAPFRSGMLDIPVAKEHETTPELLQKMLYYNVIINHDGTTGKGLPND